MPSQGEVLVDSQSANDVTALLHDFDIAKHQLKPRHIDWLRKNVVGLLRRGGSIGITGMASPSGTDAFNLGLSRRRVDEVLQFLRQESGKNFRVTVDMAMGERVARAFKVANGTEDGFWRGAVLTVRVSPTPPPPPPPPKPRPIPVTQVQRIVYRFFSNIKGSYSNAQKPDPVKAGMKAIGEFIKMRLKSASFVDGGETLQKRRYADIDQRHRVNQVHIRRTRVDEGGWNHEFEGYEYEIEYRWGAPLEHVTVFYYHMGGGLRKVTNPHPVPTIIPIVRNDAETEPLLSPIHVVDHRFLSH